MSTTSTQRMQKWRRETKQKRLLADAFVHDRDMSVDDTPDDEVVDKIVEFAEGLIVPSGMLSNKPFILPDWQVEFLRGALAPGVREAGLSVARKNGKSGLIALLLLAFLTGTVRRRGWRTLVCSLTGRLAMELWLAMEALIVRNQLLSVEMKKTPQPGVAFGVGDTRVDFLAADRASGHAVGADLAIVDEAGLLTERERPLWNAMMSSISGRDGKLICISIRGDGPMFDEMSQRADHDTVHWVEYAAPLGADFADPATWHAANPGLSTGIKSI